MNKPLTAEEAKNLTFPCFLEVWDYQRMENAPIYLIVESFENSKFKASHGSTWIQAALPSPEIAEAMKRQFEIKSEFIDNSLQNFNADEARKICENILNGELRKILCIIKKQAEGGEKFLYVFKKLEDLTFHGLLSRGFTIIEHSDATIRTKGLYCTIKW